MSLPMTYFSKTIVEGIDDSLSLQLGQATNISVQCNFSLPEHSVQHEYSSGGKSRGLDHLNPETID